MQAPYPSFLLMCRESERCIYWITTAAAAWVSWSVQFPHVKFCSCLENLRKICQNRWVIQHNHRAQMHKTFIAALAWYSSSTVIGLFILFMPALIFSIKPQRLYHDKSALSAVKTCVRKMGTLCLLITVKHHPTWTDSRYLRSEGQALQVSSLCCQWSKVQQEHALQPQVW